MSRHVRLNSNDFVNPHWTERADRIGDKPVAVNSPTVGLMGEDPNGDLLLPTWKLRPNWWDRRLNLRRPTHWLPYLRSRLTRKLVWLDD